MFHKVVYKHCSGKVEKVYVSVQQIYSGQYVAYLILSESIGNCRRYDKNMLVCFFGSQCTYGSRKHDL